MTTKSGQRRRVDRATGTGAHQQRDLRHDAGEAHVAAEDLAIAGQRLDALLDAGAAGVVDAHQRPATAASQVLHLGDLLGVRLAKRATQDGAVLRVGVDDAAVDLTKAADDAIARQIALGHAKQARAVLHLPIELGETARVEHLLEARQRGQLGATHQRLLWRRRHLFLHGHLGRRFELLDLRLGLHHARTCGAAGTAATLLFGHGQQDPRHHPRLCHLDLNLRRAGLQRQRPCPCPLVQGHLPAAVGASHLDLAQIDPGTDAHRLQHRLFHRPQRRQLGIRPLGRCRLRLFAHREIGGRKARIPRLDALDVDARRQPRRRRQEGHRLAGAVRQRQPWQRPAGADHGDFGGHPGDRCRW